MTAQILFKFRSDFCGFNWSLPLILARTQGCSLSSSCYGIPGGCSCRARASYRLSARAVVALAFLVAVVVGLGHPIALVLG